MFINRNDKIVTNQLMSDSREKSSFRSFDEMEQDLVENIDKLPQLHRVAVLSGEKHDVAEETFKQDRNSLAAMCASEVAFAPLMEALQSALNKIPKEEQESSPKGRPRKSRSEIVATPSSKEDQQKSHQAEKNSESQNVAINPFTRLVSWAKSVLEKFFPETNISIDPKNQSRDIQVKRLGDYQKEHDQILYQERSATPEQIEQLLPIVQAEVKERIGSISMDQEFKYIDTESATPKQPEIYSVSDILNRIAELMAIDGTSSFRTVNDKLNTKIELLFAVLGQKKGKMNSGARDIMVRRSILMESERKTTSPIDKITELKRNLDLSEGIGYNQITVGDVIRIAEELVVQEDDASVKEGMILTRYLLPSNRNYDSIKKWLQEKGR